MNKFKRIVMNTWGKKGEMWLTQLPSIVESLVDHWNISNIKPVANMSYNYVALAIQNTAPVVLKISCDEQLILDEYNALNHFAGHGTIRVLDINKKHHALLLEQAIPGQLLNKDRSIKIDNTIRIYADVVKAISEQPLSNHEYTHVSKWCNAIDRIEDPRVEKNFIDCSHELRSYLLNSEKNEYLCHGDLHLENVIKHGDTWLAIDPKGVIGEMAFEASAFDLIDQSEWKDSKAIQDKIINRINLLADMLQLDKDRLLAWIFLRVIISAQWFIEDNGDPDEMLTLASYIYPLITKRYHKQNVCQTYEKISDWYTNHRSLDLFEKLYLDKVISLIRPHGAILDLGCGTGEPIAKYFIENNFSVTGIDASENQIEKAKIKLPNMVAIHKDMRTLNLNKKFDCIVAWHSYFHLPKDDQRLMFRVFAEHMKPDGILLFTSGPTEGEIWSDNSGEMLYHASLSTQEYHSLLLQHHFKVLYHKIEDLECGKATVWIAKYQETQA